MITMHEARNAAAWALFALTGMNQMEIPAAQIVNGTVQNDTYFYGESPPVYPSPIGSGNATTAWASSYAKAAALVAQMTTNEKVNLTGGITDATSGCSGVITNITRLGFPGLCLNDAGNGVRGTDFVNGYAAGLSVGASWNKALAGERGSHMGKEFRTKGVNIALGPVVGPLGRIVESGRNWEGFANDPYLCGSLASSHIQGVQSQGVITSVKHFIGNEQETNRNPTTLANGTIVESTSSNIDDQTIHELYLWPFQDAIYAGTGNVMCSYNRVNNSYACQNSKTLNGLLKTELGYEGFVVSDWGAQHAGVASALAGLDMVMPTPTNFWGDELVAAVANGSVPESRLDDMATRIIATWYQLGQDTGFPARGVGLPADYSKPHPIVNARDPASKATILSGAIEGHVLVKNINNALPLVKPQMLSLFGYDAKTPDQVGLASGFGWTFGYEEFATGPSLLSLLLGGTAPSSSISNLGVQIMGGGSGAVTPAYWDSPYDSISQRAYADDTYLQWDFTTANSSTIVDPASAACLVFINAFASEGVDRIELSDSFSDDLVNNVAAKCNNTIVVIHNAGARPVDGFVDNPNVTAIVYAHTPGQDAGKSITALLYGDENFSGKMPYTVAKNASDYGLLSSPAQPEGQFSLFPQANFSEGVYIDYRAFDAQNITPQYEFGFGLSYTTFNYTDLNITYLGPGNKGPYPLASVQAGGAADLWDSVAFVTANITNTGSVAGQEVSQLYVGIPNGPIRQLRGFDKRGLNAGESYTVEYTLTRRDLSYWETAARQWNMQSGAYKIYVGRSSRDLPLTGTLNIS